MPNQLFASCFYKTARRKECIMLLRVTVVKQTLLSSCMWVLTSTTRTTNMINVYKDLFGGFLKIFVIFFSVFSFSFCDRARLPVSSFLQEFLIKNLFYQPFRHAFPPFFHIACFVLYRGSFRKPCFDVSVHLGLNSCFC